MIVGLADRPRRARRVGALNALSLPYAVAPNAVGRLAARLGRRFYLEAGSPAAPTPGGLFESGTAEAVVRSGWGKPRRRLLTGAIEGLRRRRRRASG